LQEIFMRGENEPIQAMFCHVSPEAVVEAALKQFSAQFDAVGKCALSPDKRGNGVKKMGENPKTKPGTRN
jgi:hypothetical protein